MYKKRGRKLKKPHKELFEYQYYTLNMSGEEMAKMYEVKPRTIYNWATEYRKKSGIIERSVMSKKNTLKFVG